MDVPFGSPVHLIDCLTIVCPDFGTRKQQEQEQEQEHQEQEEEKPAQTSEVKEPAQGVCGKWLGSYGRRMRCALKNEQSYMQFLFLA